MITIDEMKELENLALEQGITTQQLMENAGKQVFRAVKKRVDLKGKHVIIFAGSGHNGGDGFAAARHFAEESHVLVLYFGQKEKMAEETRKKYSRIKYKINVLAIESAEQLKQFRFQKEAKLILVDALLGTGIKGKIKEPTALAIDYFNSLNGYKVAIDVPSGIHPDTGITEEKACAADLIVSLHDTKKGLEALKDKTVVVDIGMPRKVLID